MGSASTNRCDQRAMASVATELRRRDRADERLSNTTVTLASVASDYENHLAGSGWHRRVPFSIPGATQQKGGGRRRRPPWRLCYRPPDPPPPPAPSPPAPPPPPPAPPPPAPPPPALPPPRPPPPPPVPPPAGALPRPPPDGLPVVLGQPPLPPVPRPPLDPPRAPFDMSFPLVWVWNATAAFAFEIYAMAVPVQHDASGSET